MNAKLPDPPCSEPYIEPANQELIDNWQYTRTAHTLERDESGNQFVSMEFPRNTRKLITDLVPAQEQ